MYESTPAYASQQQGPATRPIDEPEWKSTGKEYAASMGGNKSPGKGERDLWRQGTRQDNMITP